MYVVAFPGDADPARAVERLRAHGGPVIVARRPSDLRLDVDALVCSADALLPEGAAAAAMEALRSSEAAWAAPLRDGSSGAIALPVILDRPLVDGYAVVRGGEPIALEGPSEWDEAQPEWDLWMRVAARGTGLALPASLAPGRRPLTAAERVGASLLGAHDALYRAHLVEVLVEKERRMGALYRRIYDLERELTPRAGAADRSLSRAVTGLQTRLTDLRTSLSWRATAPVRVALDRLRGGPCAPGAIAVVVCCYELGPLLEEAVASVWAQTRPASEVVVVDDGSRDVATRDALDAVERQGARVLRRPHAGVAAAREAGVRATTAPYLVLLDGDDELAPTYLERTAQRLDADPGLHFVSTRVRAFGAASWEAGMQGCGLLEHLTNGSFHVSTAMRRELYDALGGFDPALPAQEDWDFWLCALEQDFRGEVVPEPLLRYRIRSGSRNDLGFTEAHYLPTVERILRKHAPTVAAVGPALVPARDAYLATLAGHVRQLEARRARRTPAIRAEAPGVVLFWHRVAGLDPDENHLCVAEDLFDEQLDAIARHAAVLDLQDAVARQRRGSLDVPWIALTLDDGYLDALHAAAPRLEARGLPATFFVNTDRLGERHEAWWDLVELALLGAHDAPTVLHLAVGGRRLCLETATPGERRRARHELGELGWLLTLEERDELVAGVLQWAGVPVSVRDSHRLLTAEEMRALAARPGMRLGAHTVHHLNLTVQPAAVRWSEVLEGRRVLETQVGRAVDAFCYPYGDHDDVVVADVREAGYVLAVTTLPGLVRAGTDAHRLPRHEVPALGGEGFRRWLQEILPA